MGQINAGTQFLNGFRTQTDGRALTTGYSVTAATGGILCNPTIQWIGNAGLGVIPGNLDFKYAISPGAPGIPQADVTMFVMAPVSPSSILPFSYASSGALVGQLQNGRLGNFTTRDIWSATGAVTTPSFETYGTRHQYTGFTLNSGLLRDFNTNITDAVIDYGSNNSDDTRFPFVFKFISFTNPSDPRTVKNIWQSGNQFSNIVLGRQDYNAINSSQYYLSLFDGQSTTAGVVATNFINRAGILATHDGFDEFGNKIENYAAIVGDVSRAANNGFGHIGVLGISDDDANFGGNKWAGYFVGSVVVTGIVNSPSDRKFKTDITDEKNMMSKLMLLKPKSYLFDTKNNKNMSFSRKLQHGLISQEVEEVFPELVQDILGPSSSSNPKEDGKPTLYKSLIYNGLIPMLLKGIQEQQAEIDALKEQIKSNTTLVLSNKTEVPTEVENAAFSLSQNIPNPFTESTVISYNIPANVNRALLAIFDLNGKMLLQYNLVQGKNQLTIRGSQLPAGMYIYSLIADGAEVVSKRMVLSK